MGELQQYLQNLQQLLFQEGGLLLRRLAAAVLVVLLVYLVYRWIVRAINGLSTRGRLSQHTHTILKKICYWAFCLFAVLLALQQLGMMENAWTTLTALVAVVGVGFVAVWSILSNLFCSVVLMITRPFDVGDTIELPGDDIRGKVIDFDLIYTTLRDTDGSLLQVPNNLFFQKIIRRQVGTHTLTLDQQADRVEPVE
jgi:small-conductance mechanosensitive channel